MTRRQRAAQTRQSSKAFQALFRFLVPALLVSELLGAVDAARSRAQSGHSPVPPVRGGETPPPPKRALIASVHEIYEKVAPAVVGITCRRGSREAYFGTGMIVDPAGLVLTSTTVVPPGARDIRVYLQGSRVRSAELLEAEPELEVSVLRIEDLRGSVPGVVALGDSDEVAVGDPAFTFGNAFQSIERDDRVVFAAGIVSGLYEVEEARSEATYVGPVIETTAAVNNGMDGGPLVNARGELVGILSLNYSRTRWLGTAVPINAVKPVLARRRGWFDDRRAGLPVYAGLELEEVGGREVRVLRVRPQGPAAAAGLKPGDRVLAADGRRLESVSEFRRILSAKKPGETVTLRVLRGDRELEIRFKLSGRF